MATQVFGPSALVTPANAITLGRVLLLPFFVAMVLAGDLEWAALVLWVLLAGTDGADGYIARRQGTTRSGAFLDPLADKVLVLGAMTALVAENRIWWVPVAIIAVREVVVSAYRSYVGRQGVSVPARGLAKVKTVVQDVAVGAAVVPAYGSTYRAFLATVLWGAVALTVVTGAQYLLDHRHSVQATQAGAAFRPPRPAG